MRIQDKQVGEEEFKKRKEENRKIRMKDERRESEWS